MAEVIFKNTRFDPDLVEFHEHAKKMAGSVGYTAKLTIDSQLAQLLRLRVAQINPCSYCLILHNKAAADQAICNRCFQATSNQGMRSPTLWMG